MGIIFRDCGVPTMLAFFLIDNFIRFFFSQIFLKDILRKRHFEVGDIMNGDVLTMTTNSHVIN